jgi:hypothetical protein
MKERYSERIPTLFPVIISIDTLSWEGRVLDLTLSGCLIETPFVVKKGEYVKLSLFIPDLEDPVSVELTAVRWTNGLQFGVEFIRMTPEEQQRLDQVIARHQPAAPQTVEEVPCV